MSKDYAIQSKLKARKVGHEGDVDMEDYQDNYEGLDDESMAQLLAAGAIGDENERATH